MQRWVYTRLFCIIQRNFAQILQFWVMCTVRTINDVVFQCIMPRQPSCIYLAYIRMYVATVEQIAPKRPSICDSSEKTASFTVPSVCTTRRSRWLQHCVQHGLTCVQLHSVVFLQYYILWPRLCYILHTAQLGLGLLRQRQQTAVTAAATTYAQQVLWSLMSARTIKLGFLY